MCPYHLSSTWSYESFDCRRGIEGVLLHECSMSNLICTALCWRNNYISPMPPSDDGLYLTAVWMVLQRSDQGKPYFTMGAVITWNYSPVGFIDLRGYFKVWGIFNLRAFHASYFCLPPDHTEVSQVSPCPAPAVGRRRRDQTLQVSAPRYPKSIHRRHSAPTP